MSKIERHATGDTDYCPRAIESGVTPGSPFKITGDCNWRSDHTCSYCGSLSSEKFIEALRAGHQLIPTDKNYKVYVWMPNPDAGKLSVFASTNCETAGYTKVTPENFDTLPLRAADRDHYMGQWVRIEPEPPRRQVKFYFQHLSVNGCMLLLDMLNAKKVNFAAPGHFYVKPYFIQ